MPKQVRKFELTRSEKNEISSIAELAIRSDEMKAKRKWQDLHTYIESIMEKVKIICLPDETVEEEKEE